MTLPASLGFLREHPEGCAIAVRVQPGAKRTAIVGILGEGSTCQLKIALQAPPVDGKANEALVAYLAKVLSMARSRIVLLHGERDRSKLLLLRGVRVDEAEAMLRAGM